MSRSYKFKKILFVNRFQSIIFIALVDYSLDLCEHNNIICSAISVLQRTAISQSKIYLHRTRPKATGSLPCIPNTLIKWYVVLIIIQILLIYTKKNRNKTSILYCYSS